MQIGRIEGTQPPTLRAEVGGIRWRRALVVRRAQLLEEVDRRRCSRRPRGRGKADVRLQLLQLERPPPAGRNLRMRSNRTAVALEELLELVERRQQVGSPQAEPLLPQGGFVDVNSFIRVWTW